MARAISLDRSLLAPEVGRSGAATILALAAPTRPATAQRVLGLSYIHMTMLGAWSALYYAITGAVDPDRMLTNAGAAYSFLYILLCTVVVTLVMWLFKVRLSDIAR